LIEPYILWLGSAFDETTLLRYRAASPSANRWETGLISALQSLGQPIKVLGHLPEPLWPNGRLYIRKETGRLAAGLEGNLISYWNVPQWRERSLVKAYQRSFQAMCREHGKPGLVISYNDGPANTAIGWHGQHELGIPWICCIADLPDPGPNWGRFNAMTAQAAGLIFLSWGAYTNAPFKSKFHLDGGVVGFRAQARVHRSPKPVVVYTGVLNQYGGVSLLVDAFHRLQKPDIELWICGKGTNADVERLRRVDSRIKVWGMVTEERLSEVCRTATLFVNPRPSTVADNKMNFPSKVLEYLTYGYPIVSMWTEGLNPTYRDVLVTVEEETPECLARKIEAVLEWDEARRDAEANKIRRFVETEKLWPVQVRRLLVWLETLTKG
jgi:glycosyltransferase involved in cell wall biosynthesis